MKGPEVNPENHQQIYEYYAHIKPSKRMINAIHRASRLLYRPRVDFAEQAEEEIAERIDGQNRLIVASNHLNIADQFPISALIDRLDVLKPLEGRTFALAKSEYFTKPYLKSGLDATGTIPVFRPQDVGQNLRLQADATRSLIDATTTRLIEGWNMLIFPEGTRNRGNPSKIGRIQGGIGRIASQASQDVGVSILPVALWYGPEEDHHYLTPDVFINRPIDGPFATKREVVGALRSALQGSVDQVIHQSESK